MEIHRFEGILYLGCVSSHTCLCVLKFVDQMSKEKINENIYKLHLLHDDYFLLLLFLIKTLFNLLLLLCVWCVCVYIGACVAYCAC